MLSARLTAPVRRLALRPAHSALRSEIANQRPYVTSPLTPDPTAKPAAADLPVKPAYDNVPFAAPTNKDETRGQLGQVDLPDMEKVEHEAEEEFTVRIVSFLSAIASIEVLLTSSLALFPRAQPTAPDTYRSAETSPDAPSDPVGHAPQVATASHPSTYHGGGPSLNKAGQDGDVVVNQHGEGERKSEGRGEKKKNDDGARSTQGQQKSEEQDKKSYKYEWKDRRLDADEKRGLYIVGGMLVGGYVLSTLTERKSIQHKQ